MAELNVYIQSREFDDENQQKAANFSVRTGVLTTEHVAADEDRPVIVEDVTERVYAPGELPSDAVVYVQGPPGELPPLAKLAKRAGFRIKAGTEFKDEESASA